MGWPKQFDTAFDTYKVIEAIGEGGAGKVFAVRNESGENLALKCLSPNRITTERRKRFKNEIAFCSKFEHKNIIQVLDVGLSVIDAINCPFYVMPNFSATLRQLLNEGIAPETALPLFSQILDGVDAAHKMNAFHRDIKPENILYERSKNLLVIADFGIAHFDEDIIATQVVTQASAKMANLGYSAPEQRTKGSKVNHRADIFSLGLILNEMFTGVVPHGVGYKTIASVSPEYAYLDSIVEWMIQNNEGLRPDSIETVKKELISRGNTFVALQKVDAITKEIVPAFEAESFNPIKIVSPDWDDGRLIIELDRQPESPWIQRFKQPGGSWSSIMGAGPENFHFSGNRAYVGASENEAQQILNYAKGYIDMANRAYQNDLKSKAKKEEQAFREKLNQERAATEARARVVSKLKI